MKRLAWVLNLVVAAWLAFPVGGAGAQQPPLPDDPQALLDRLAQSEEERWRRIEQRLVRIWSRSGSASVDLLLRRGRNALEDGDTGAAIDHLSAVTDHAPGFAEGWHSRATAWFMDGRLGLAMADLQRALRLNPQHFAAMIGVGRILEEVGRVDDARAVMARAHAIHPHRTDIKDALERLDEAVQGSAL